MLITQKGYCVTCDQDTTFSSNHPWLRDFFECEKCKSIPRERAIIYIIEKYYPDWRELKIHESSPYPRGASPKLKKYGKYYTETHYFPDNKPGEVVDGFRNENLENQTFEDNSFDLVITLDVFEHVFNPDKAFKEIARTLKPGGAHIFTVPLTNGTNKSEVRAKIDENGNVTHVKDPEYHSNPLHNKGCLVTMDWGTDIVDYIQRHSGLETKIETPDDMNLGIRAKYIDVLISTKINIGFVVVTHDNENDLKRLLPTLPTSKNVVIIDNSSTDKTCEIAEKFGAYVVKNNDNKGYAAAINQGIKYLYDTCSHFFILNPDTEIKKMNFNEEDLQKYGIVQPLILLPDNTANVEELQMNIFGFVYPENYGNKPKITHKKEINFASGAAFIVSRKALDKIGFLDESLFLYYNDVDYSIRCRMAGEKILFSPESVVVHHCKSSIGNKNKQKWILKNRKIIANRYLPDLWRKLIFIKKRQNDKYTLSAENKEKFAQMIKKDLLLRLDTKQIPLPLRVLTNLFMKTYSWLILHTNAFRPSKQKSY